MSDQRAAAAVGGGNAVRPAGGAGGQQQQQQGGFMSIVSTIIRFLLMYYLATFILGKLFGTNNSPSVNIEYNSTDSSNNNNSNITSNNIRLTNLWPEGSTFDLKVYFSASDSYIGEWLVLDESDLTYDYNNVDIYKNYTFNTPEYLKTNGSLYAHIIATKHAYLNQPKSSLHKVHQLNTYLPRGKPKGKLLLEMNKEEEEESEKLDPNEYISYFKPTLSLHLIVDSVVYPPESIPKEIISSFNITNNKYSPIIYCNEFWLFKDHLIPVNETVEELSIEISYSSMSLFKWQFQTQVEKSFEMQESIGAGSNVGEEVKRMFLDNEPWVLVLTLIVSVLHTIFEFLAFKNDIQFWKNNKSMEGLSVKTITLNCISSTIIFLYLLDYETSYMILASVGFGTLLEFWKLTKAVNITVVWMEGLPLPRKIIFKNKDEYVSKTKEYDDMAMKYLSWVLMPLVIGTSIYSLYNYEQKSWYSWIVSSLVRTIYTFEFIKITPQLFINYKLKSVSRLPWRVFMYRTLNTFIDDLFAFIIKMPLLHRLSCLKDDIVFIIYLYQRWIYPVDVNRAEYGYETDNDPAILALKKKDNQVDSNKLIQNTQENENEKIQDQENEEEETTSSTTTKVTKRKTKKI